MLNEINSWIDEIPPLQQPMRFGNKAFRTFFDRVVTVPNQLPTIWQLHCEFASSGVVLTYFI